MLTPVQLTAAPDAGTAYAHLMSRLTLALKIAMRAATIYAAHKSRRPRAHPTAASDVEMGCAHLTSLSRPALRTAMCAATMSAAQRKRCQHAPVIVLRVVAEMIFAMLTKRAIAAH